MNDDGAVNTVEMAGVFFDAVAAGDVAAVRSILDARPQLLAAVSVEGDRAPLRALAAGHTALADELAARSGPLDVHEASAFDDTGRLRTILRENPEALTSWSLAGWQALHLASGYGRVEAVRQLLDADAPVDEASHNSLRATPLHVACTIGHPEVTWVLIASGADVNRPQAGGIRPLHLAAAGSHAEAVRALLAAGADPGLTDEDGRRPQDLATGEAISALAG